MNNVKYRKGNKTLVVKIAQPGFSVLNNPNIKRALPTLAEANRKQVKDGWSRI